MDVFVGGCGTCSRRFFLKSPMKIFVIDEKIFEKFIIVGVKFINISMFVVWSVQARNTKVSI